MVMEALFRLRWQAFLKWLSTADQESVRSNLDEQHFIEKVKTFQMSIKNKGNVSQNAESMVSELKPLMEQFEAFRHGQKSKSHMFAFWDEYISMMMILLQFIKAERSANWPLHLTATTAMVPYFYAHDRPNYSRWLPVYLADMAQLVKPTICVDRHGFGAVDKFGFQVKRRHCWNQSKPRSPSEMVCYDP